MPMERLPPGSLHPHTGCSLPDVARKWQTVEAHVRTSLHLRNYPAQVSEREMSEAFGFGSSVPGPRRFQTRR